jgi:hypothetical protein
MKSWMKVGINVVPELEETIRLSSNSMSLWISINDVWIHLDDTTKFKVFKFAKWCFSQGGDLHNGVVSAFIEHVLYDNKNWEYFKGSFSDRDINEMTYVWTYMQKDDPNKLMNELLNYGRT